MGEPEEAGAIVTKRLGLTALTRMTCSLAIRTGGMRAETECICERPKGVSQWRQRSVADTCGQRGEGFKNGAVENQPRGHVCFLVGIGHARRAVIGVAICHMRIYALQSTGERILNGI